MISIICISIYISIYILYIDIQIVSYHIVYINIYICIYIYIYIYRYAYNIHYTYNAREIWVQYPNLRRYPILVCSAPISQCTDMISARSAPVRRYLYRLALRRKSD